MCLLSIIFVFFFIFTNLLKGKLSRLEELAGIWIFIILIVSYLYSALRNPGIPELSNFNLQSDPKVEIKKCRECRNYVRMDRQTYHCFECNVCIEGYDHHCPWMTKCIGKNTKYSFYTFVLSIMIAMTYLIFMVAVYGGN